MNSPKKDKVLIGWHFMPKDMTLQYGDGRKVTVGKWVSQLSKDPPKVCYRGMHMCQDLTHVLEFGRRGCQLCYVEVRGRMDIGSSKVSADQRRVLWHIDATEAFREFLTWLKKKPSSWFCDAASARYIKSDIKDALSPKNIFFDALTCAAADALTYDLRDTKREEAKKKLEEIIFKYARRQWDGVEK